MRQQTEYPVSYLNLLLVSCQISEAEETFLGRDEDTSDHLVAGPGLEDVVEVVEADAVRPVQRVQHRLVKIDTFVNLEVEMFFFCEGAVYK